MITDDNRTITGSQATDREDRLVDAAADHLRLALETSDREASRYHVRSALQALYIFREGEST